MTHTERGKKNNKKKKEKGVATCCRVLQRTQLRV